MLVFGIFLVFLIGFLAVNVVSFKFSACEKLGLAFPLGIGLQTLAMLILNLCCCRLTVLSVLVVALSLVLILVFLLYRRRAEAAAHYKRFFCRLDDNYTLPGLFLLVLIAWLEYMNFTKCIYFPTFDRDSLAGFDTIGYVVSREHTFRYLSLFKTAYNPMIQQAGSYLTYAPMVQLSYAFVYLLGAETSKLIPALVYLSFLVAFYGAMRRIIPFTGAMLATFFMMITPEMIAFSSLSATNVIHAVSASLAVIYVALWFRFRKRRDLLLGVLFLALNVWTRTDGVVFIGAALCVVIIDGRKRRSLKETMMVACSFAPALLWVLFCKVCHFRAEGIVILRFFWDPDKAGTIATYMKAYYTAGTQFFGWTFVVAALSSLLNMYAFLRRRDNAALLAMIVLASLFYMFVLYQIDYKWDSIERVLSYSAKRFLFCFVPLLWFYSLSCSWAVWLFGKVDGWMGLKEEC